MFNISLLLSAAVIIICVLANKLSNKIGMPVLIAFIALGMVFGSDGILKIPFENYSFAEQICGSYFHGGSYNSVLFFCFKNKIARKYAYRCGYEFY